MNALLPERLSECFRVLRSVSVCFEIESLARVFWECCVRVRMVERRRGGGRFVRLDEGARRARFVMAWGGIWLW